MRSIAEAGSSSCSGEEQLSELEGVQNGSSGRLSCKRVRDGLAGNNRGIGHLLLCWWMKQ